MFFPKTLDVFQSPLSRYDRWNVTLNIGPLSASCFQMLALSAPWRMWWTGGLFGADSGIWLEAGEQARWPRGLAEVVWLVIGDRNWE